MATEDYFCRFCALESEGFEDPYACQLDLEKTNYKEIFPELLHNDFHSKSEYICARHRLGISVHQYGAVRKPDKPGNVSTSSFMYNIANPKTRDERKRTEERKSPQGENMNGRLRITSSKPGSPTQDRSHSKACTTNHGQPTNRGPERKHDCCCCSEYHHHTFESPEFYIPKDESCSKLEATLTQSHREVDQANETFLNISNAFWYPSLCLNQFSSEFNYTNFESLWPQEDVLRDILRDSIQNTVLRGAIPQLTKVAIVCGPVDMLKSLISLSLVSKYYNACLSYVSIYMLCICKKEIIIHLRGKHRQYCLNYIITNI